MADNAENLLIYDISQVSSTVIHYMDTVRTDTRRNTPVHVHDFWQIEAATGQEFTALLDEREIPVRNGDILIFPPGTAHGFAYARVPVHWVTIKFSFPCPVRRVWGLLKPGSPVYETAALLVSFICRSALKGDEGRRLAEGLVAAIAGMWAVHCGHRKHPYRITVDLLIENKKGGPLTVAEAAEKNGCSTGHLSRVFRELAGVTLKTYIDRARSDYLVRQLHYTTLSISEIARNTGFPDIYTFSRFIKNHTGVSPRALRKT